MKEHQCLLCGRIIGSKYGKHCSRCKYKLDPEKYRLKSRIWKKENPDIQKMRTGLIPGSSLSCLRGHTSGRYKNGACRECNLDRCLAERTAAKAAREAAKPKIPEGHKKCSGKFGCGEIKPHSEFYPVQKIKCGYDTMCKSCKAKYTTESFEKNPERKVKRSKYAKIYAARPGTKENRALTAKRWARTPNGWAKSLYFRTLKRNLELGFSPPDYDQRWLVHQLVDVQNFKCYYNSNITLDPGAGTRAWNLPSPDRIDCSKGYFKDNIRITCLVWNTARQDRSIEQTLKILSSWVSKPKRKRPPSIESLPLFEEQS